MTTFNFKQRITLIGIRICATCRNCVSDIYMTEKCTCMCWTGALLLYVVFVTMLNNFSSTNFLIAINSLVHTSSIVSDFFHDFSFNICRHWYTPCADTYILTTVQHTLWSPLQQTPTSDVLNCTLLNLHMKKYLDWHSNDIRYNNCNMNWHH